MNLRILLTTLLGLIPVAANATIFDDGNAAFAKAAGVTLPGTEPSTELLAAVKTITEEGMGRCAPLEP